MTTSNPDAAITKEFQVSLVKEATENVFGTMLGMEVTVGEPFTQKPTASTPASGVVSLIGLAGPWMGTGSVSCTEACACKLSSRLLMAEYDAVNEDVIDAIAEITNMIMGNVKTALEERLGSMGLSTPTVIFGTSFQTRSVRSQDWTVVPFETEGERVFVQICMTPARDNQVKELRAGYPIPQVLNV